MSVNVKTKSSMSKYYGDIMTNCQKFKKNVLNVIKVKNIKALKISENVFNVNIVRNFKIFIDVTAP